MSTPTPAMKHRRLEDQETFVPPLFHMPVRPPANGFPCETDIVIAGAAKNSSSGNKGIDSKALLLNASPTLEFPAEDAAALLTALRQHPKCAEIREQLEGINEAYIESIFGEEDAREDDTRRRVDYNSACAVLKSNSSKRLSICVSCLTRGQHRHYRSWMITYMQTGVLPKATEDYPDMSTVLDLVQREQTAYLHKFMEETISCEACKLEAGYNKRSLGAGEASASHRACWNHNYLDEHVERFAKRWWRYRLESQVQLCLLDAEGNESRNDKSKNDTVREVVWDLKKTAASAEGMPLATLTPRTRQLATRRVADTIALRESLGRSRVLPAVAIPPSLPLPVQQLDEREPKLHPTTHTEQQHHEEEGVEKEERPPVHPVKTVPGVSFTVRVCKSALLELATAHLSSCRAGFRLPLRCTWHPEERRLHICFDKPLPAGRESRRNISASALKRLVDSDPHLPSNGRCSVMGRGESRCYADVSFGKDISIQCVANCAYDINGHNPVFRMVKIEYNCKGQCVANCAYDINGHNPVFRMVKIEYNCKGYNTVPDDEKTFHYESFSKREVVRMWVLLHCYPTAILYVYRVNAYSNAVIGIEQFSAVSFMSQVMGLWSSDAEVQRTWSSLHDVLENVVSAVVRQKLPLLEQPDGAGNFTFILSKELGDGSLSLCSVRACYPQLQLDETVTSFIEPSSRAVCRREYLPPCVWPFHDRIPYTYAPAPKTCYVINRTTETRHESAYYAKHDVWHHESRYYTVGEDGIVRERLEP
ncbi:hypothetical protein DQ04_03401010 [Trypanosoma grayi]|uniref:hypothetical protein n=1 Tax=Trypanosoma grayi TaxID=71804 RepID=UPI0004F46135|nr:hypothetical protein DQ04_03401010 [Trypanosoma grayi]KEG10694.1 hypothetical protein DQ04_03401010 [Trypanosoma grayi]